MLRSFFDLAQRDPHKHVRLALNRLIVACRDEAIALDLAALRIQGPERKERVMEQLRRRTVFCSDLSAGVIALGGVPADRPSLRARFAGLLATLEKTPPQPTYHGSVYAACARAVERTTRAYTKALHLDLPADVRFGLERQFVEVEYDRKELRWLCHGGSLTSMPGQRPREIGESPEASRAAHEALTTGSRGEPGSSRSS